MEEEAVVGKIYLEQFFYLIKKKNCLCRQNHFFRVIVCVLLEDFMKKQ